MMLNISPKTAQAWEQGSREPSDAALKLLTIRKRHPDVLFELEILSHASGVRIFRRSKSVIIIIRQELKRRNIRLEVIHGRKAKQSYGIEGGGWA